MNILVITPFYKQDKNIASVRWTNISARLARRHNVIVVTQPYNDMDMQTGIQKDEDDILVARINQKTAYEKIAIKHFGGATGDDWQTASASDQVSDAAIKEGFVRKLKNHVLFAAMKQKARSYAKEIHKNVIPKGVKIDVVISSACPFIEMLFGYEVKKRLKCKWISDFRDLPFVETKTHEACMMKKIMQKYLSIADAAVVIAKSGKAFLQEEIIKDSNKIHVITNGFSASDAMPSTFIDDNTLHIVHTGSLYAGRRRADLLLKAFVQLKETNPQYQFVLECAGGNNKTLLQAAEKYNLDGRVIDKGFLPREEALKLQNSADCLVAFVENIPGSLSAKLFEYALCRKPIICVTCGSQDGGDNEDFVETHSLGISVKESDGQEAVDLLSAYLQKQIERKLKKVPLEYNPKTEELQQFNHDNIVVKFEQLCESLM